MAGERPMDGKIRDVLHDRPVLVTGADGFVGSHLTEALLDYGAKVHVLVRATSSGMLHNIAPLQRRVTIHRGDLADKQAVLQVLRALKGDGERPIIFHLGAQAHVGECWSRPYETLTVNVLGTVNLLQSIVDLNLDVYRVDTAGSSEEYGNVRADVRDQYRFEADGALVLDECSPVNPQSVYATSKLAADFLTRNYFAGYAVPTIVTRMFNNYGPRQSPRFITGTIITQALSGDVVQLGYVTSRRDFCFVKDGVRGHICATLFGNPGETYVYGSGRSISILDWYDMIIRIGQKHGYWGEKELQATDGRARLGKSEVEELRVDYAKLTTLTQWKPEYSWEDGLSETIDWYAASRDQWIGRVDW